MLRRVLLAIASTVLTLVVVETVVRVSGLEERWVEPLTPRQNADSSLHRPTSDEELLYELIPNRSASLPNESEYGTPTRRIGINSLGFRGSEPKHRSKTGFRVLALGGSNTYGAAVSDDETWPALLEAELTRRGLEDVEVWNLGVSGYSTRQKVRLAEKWLHKADPDVIVFQLYNIGPRYFHPDSEPLDYGGHSAYSEFMNSVPTSKLGSVLFSLSALRRLWTYATERRQRATNISEHTRLLTERTEEVDSRRLAEFLAGDPPATFAVVVGKGFPSRQVEESGISALVMENMEIPPGLESEALEIHPGRNVYAWCATSIADYMQEAGCLSADGCRFTR